MTILPAPLLRPILGTLAIALLWGCASTRSPAPIEVPSLRAVAIPEAPHPAVPEDPERVAVREILKSAEGSREAGDFAAALQQAQEALCRWRRIGDRDGEFEALFEIGSIYYLSRTDVDEPDRWYGEALRVALAAGNRPQAERAWKSLGVALVDHRLVEAQNDFEMALGLARELGDVAGQAEILVYLGYARHSQGRSEEALGLYREALPLGEQSGDPALIARIKSAMGATYASRGDSREALDSYESALKFAQEARQRDSEAAAVALTGLGFLHRRRGELRKALESFTQALDINRSARSRIGEVKVLNNLAPVYLDLGQPDSALEAYQKALALQPPEDGGKELAATLLGIGQAYLVMDRAPEALDRFQQALKAAQDAKVPRTMGAALHSMGLAQMKLGQVADAVRSFEAALPLRQRAADRLGEGSTLLELGKAWQAQGDLARADSFMRQALKLANDVEASFSQAAAHFGLARLDRERSDLQGAFTEIRTAIEILESVRSELSDDRLRSSFFASRRAYYDFYVDLLLRLDRLSPGQGYAAKALAASEMGKARSLLDLLSEERLDLTRGISPDLKRNEADVKARLSQIQRQLTDELSKERREPIVAALQARLDEVNGERRQLETRIQTDSPRYFELRYPSLLQLEGIRKQLSEDTALLEYSLGEEGAYLFVVTREDFKVHTLPASQISGQVRKFLNGAMAAQQTFAYLRAGHDLYELLIEPAKAELANKHHLLIVPDGVLLSVSFEALLTGDGAGRSAADLPYLIKSASVSYAPSVSVLSWLSLPRPGAVAGPGTGMRFLAYADPDYGSGGEAPAETRGAAAESGAAGLRFSRLEGSEREVSQIASLYPESAVKLYLGREANKENVQKNALVEGAQRLHFATHGVLDAERPELSGLALTRTGHPGDDGFLHVYEIFNLDLSADLVVLSACESGLGKEVAGEGLIGVTRAFLYAGAPSVVVSLWRVADAVAPDLMLQFYENLDGGGDKAESLRQAKLSMIRKGGRYARPYYWAPFVLVGKP